MASELLREKVLSVATMFIREYGGLSQDSNYQYCQNQAPSMIVAVYQDGIIVGLYFKPLHSKCLEFPLMGAASTPGWSGFLE